MAATNTHETLTEVSRAEYDALNAHVRALTDARVAVERTAVTVPSRIKVNGGEIVANPRDLYRAASAAIVAAENALLAIRDRNGWATAYEAHGKG